MALYLVGENIDKARGHYHAEAGKVVQLMRGVYVDADDDVDAIVLQHAVRLGKYLYPRTYLSAASAVRLGPTSDSRLFLSGRRRQRTRIRALEIIQNVAPPHPALGTACIDDGMGEFPVDVAAIRQRFLEAFRLRSEHAASIDATMREAIAQRLVEEYGGARGAADAVWMLARENEWYREGEQAERFLLRRPMPPARNAAALNLIVAWHGTSMGTLSHDGFEWRWAPADDRGPLLIRQATPGKLPPFILSLLPEGWLESVLRDRDERATLRSGKRYMSNITIVERAQELSALPSDVLQTSLDRYCSEGVFTGTYAGPERGTLAASFEYNLAQIFKRADTPRLSGVQIKAPMYLRSDGTLSPSEGVPFTHILKPAGTSGFAALPLVEWLAIALGRAAGFAAPATALVAMPDGMPPALLVERFDIRIGLDDHRRLALEDLCAALDLPPAAKYAGSLERVARTVRQRSTAPDEDVALILTRGLFAWLIADGDMHLKNLAFLSVAEPGDTRFRTVRLAPLFDAVATRVFPGLERDRLALTINGKHDRLRRADFQAFARTAGIPTSVADAAVDELVARIGAALDTVTLPHLPDCGPDGTAMPEKMRDIIRARLTSL